MRKKNYVVGFTGKLEVITVTEEQERLLMYLVDKQYIDNECMIEIPANDGYPVDIEEIMT